MDGMNGGNHSVATSNSPRPDPRLNIADAHSNPVSNRNALVLVNNYSNLSGPVLSDQLSNRSMGVRDGCNGANPLSPPNGANGAVNGSVNGSVNASHPLNGCNGAGVRMLPLSKVCSNLSNASHHQNQHRFDLKLSVRALSEKVSENRNVADGDVPSDVLNDGVQGNVQGLQLVPQQIAQSQFTINIPSNRIQEMEENCSIQRAQDPGTPEPGDDADIDDIDLSFDQHLDDALHHKLEGSLDSGDSVEMEHDVEKEAHDPLAVAAAAMGRQAIEEEQSLDSEQMEGGHCGGVQMNMMDNFGSISIASTVPRIPRPKSLTSLRGDGDVEYSLDGLAVKDMMLVVSPSRHHRRQYSLGVQQDIKNCMSVPGASSSKKFKFDGHSDHKKSQSISSHHFRL